MNRLRLLVVLALLLSTVPASSCAPRQPEEAPRTEETPTPESPESPTNDESDSFYNRLQSEGYGSWAAAPTYDEPQPARGPHGERVQIRLNEVAERALADGESEWPEGSVIAKDVFVGDRLVNLAAMEKRGDAWYFGEWDEAGEPIAEGEAIAPCQGCHQGDSDGTIGVSLGG